MKKVLFWLFIVVNIVWILSQNHYSKQLFASSQPSPSPSPDLSIQFQLRVVNQNLPTPVQEVKIEQPGNFHQLADQTYVYQTYNNCGPATLSMLLDFYQIKVSQQEIADTIRPYNNPLGYNDDKSVTLSEMASYAEEKGLSAYKRPNGDLNKIKLFIANGVPVITITWIEDNGGFGHYRIIKGFDESKQQIIQDDSIFGQNQRVSYQEFLRLWQFFNYDYLIVIPENKVEVAKAIFRDEADVKVAYQNAIIRSEKEPQNIYSSLNRSVSYYYLGDYGKSVQNFEGIQSKLPPRMLWYQIEPIQSYQKLKIYDQVFSLTDYIFQSGNPSASELYQIRGEVFLEQGKTDEANQEFAKANKFS